MEAGSEFDYYGRPVSGNLEKSIYMPCDMDSRNRKLLYR